MLKALFAVKEVELECLLKCVLFCMLVEDLRDVGAFGECSALRCRAVQPLLFHATIHPKNSPVL